ncbi:MAG: hypothetical protein JST92_14600 [Deltaproteobacteria bacterium]|nr:hypothetical protein [Deltaproteobacteria bacterium]
MLDVPLQFLHSVRAWLHLRAPLLEALIARADERPHRVCAAAHLLRLTTLCDALVLLDEHGLYTEAATLTRALTELAINCAWAGSDDQRAWSLAQDQRAPATKSWELRFRDFGVGLEHPSAADHQPLPPMQQRAEIAGAELISVYASACELLAGTERSSAHAQWERDDLGEVLNGRIYAAFAVQAAYRLIVHAWPLIEKGKLMEPVAEAMRAWAQQGLSRVEREYDDSSDPAWQQPAPSWSLALPH